MAFNPYQANWNTSNIPTPNPGGVKNMDIVMNQLGKLKSAGSSSFVFDQMLKMNPTAPNGLTFKDVCNMAKGKTPEQAFKENGLDFDQFRNLKW